MSFLRSYLLELSPLASFRSSIVDPYIVQPLSALLASSTPDLVSLVLLAILLLISLKILDYARRVVVFWVMFVLRIVFWLSLIGLAWHFYLVGPDKAWRELGWVWGVLEAWVEDLQTRADLLSQQYQHQHQQTWKSAGYGSFGGHSRRKRGGR